MENQSSISAINIAAVTVQSQVEETTKELLQSISFFEQKDFNTVPFEGSWTGAQVGEHLYKSVSGTISLLYGETKSSERSPEEKVEEIKEVFSNFDVKFTASKSLQPSEKLYDKETLLNLLEKAMKDVVVVIHSKDLSETCLNFSVPGMGELTRLEWCYLIIYHTRRHIYQIKNIQHYFRKHN